ncbi:hypothetical protein BBF93_11580 [Hyphomonas sp. CACIAM 19H1]|nr:hypothetical protein BBF93_11580 [Hyphomonas sp. CACIAM 19H1]
MAHKSRKLLVGTGWMLGGVLMVFALLAAFIGWVTSSYTIGVEVAPMGIAFFAVIGGACGLAAQRLWGAILRSRSSS